MFNFWLCIYPIFKHWLLFIHGFPSFIQRSSSEQPSTHSLRSSCPTQMPLDPYLRIPRTLKWMTSPSPIPSSDWNSWFYHSSLLNVSSAPSWHFPLILSLLHQYPLWFPSFLCLHPIILPSLPLFQSTHYSLHVYDPKTISLGRGHHGSWEGNALYQGRRSGWWLLLDHLPNGQHRSQIFNSIRPRSCDRS